MLILVIVYGLIAGVWFMTALELAVDGSSIGAAALFFLAAGFAAGAFLVFRKFVEDKKNSRRMVLAEARRMHYSSLNKIEKAQYVPQKTYRIPPEPAPATGELEGCTLVRQYRNVELAVPNVANAMGVMAGGKLALVPEPGNPYDAGAIRVYAKNALIGYLYKNDVRDMVRDWILHREPIFCSLQSCDETFGRISVFLEFYRAPNAFAANESEGGRTYRLAANRSEEMQRNIDMCKNGDAVMFSYDCNKGKYLAMCNYADIGFMPFSVTQYLGENENARALIESVQKGSDGKYIVFVKLLSAPYRPISAYRR